MEDVENSGYNGPALGDSVSLVFDKAAGIKNPSEAHDSNNNYAAGYKASYAVLGPTDSVPDAPEHNTVDDLIVRAKIALSDEDNKRGYQLTVTGSGFNNGTTAGVYVLNRAPTGDDDLAMCNDIVRNGTLVGSSLVGSDDKVVVTAEISVPTFRPGNQNYICMVDGEGRMSFDDIEQFWLQHSIRVVPGSAATGDTVNVFAQDFPVVGASFEGIRLAGRPVSAETATSIGVDHSASASFIVPDGLVGTIRADATWGGVSANTRMTVVPATEEMALSPPTNVRVNPVGSGLVNVGWDMVPNAAGYTIVAVNIADTSKVITESVNNPDAIAGQIGNLTIGAQYNIYVGSFDANLDFAIDFSEKRRVTVE